MSTWNVYRDLVLISAVVLALPWTLLITTKINEEIQELIMSAQNVST